MSIMTSIAVKDAKIHGQGVFAAREFLPDEVIIVWDQCAEILTEGEVGNLPRVPGVSDSKNMASFVDAGHLTRLPARAG